MLTPPISSSSTDAREATDLPSNPHGVDERAERMERWLEGSLLVAAPLTVPTIALEQSSAGAPGDTIATVLNWAIWLAFVAEVLVMLRVVPDRGRWLRERPLDLSIVALTPPFLPAALQAARVFRLRLLRLLKAAVLARRLLTTEGVRDAAVLALLTILGGGAAFAAVEHGHHRPELSAGDGVWWAMTTVTTLATATCRRKRTPGGSPSLSCSWGSASSRSSRGRGRPVPPRFARPTVTGRGCPARVQ